METPRNFADKMWGTEGMDNNSLSEFNIPLSSAIGMIENYCKQKDEAIEKALEVFDQYVEDGGHFYGHGIIADSINVADTNMLKSKLLKTLWFLFLF